MAGMRCVDPDAVREYIVEDGGERAVFKVTGLPKDIRMKVHDQSTRGRSLAAVWLAIQYGVKGHEGLVFPDGTPVPFETVKDEKGREIVSEKTVRIYDLAGFVHELSAEVNAGGAGSKIQALRQKLQTGPGSLSESGAGAVAGS